MRPYPPATSPDFLRQIAEIRREDISENEMLLAIAGYDKPFRRKSVAISADYSAGMQNVLLLGTAASGDITITLVASPVDGTIHWIKNRSASSNNVIVSGNGKNIDGSSTKTLTPGSAALFVFFGGLDVWETI